MTDIFISYSRNDVEVASTLARTLEALGYSVWWDMSGLHGGQAFAQVIQQKLGEAKCAIVIWSPDSVTSTWVHSEASFADSRGILLTAVYREAAAPMPFNTRHNENLRGWNGDVFDTEFQNLLKAVHRLCPVPTPSEKTNTSNPIKPQNIISDYPNQSKTAEVSISGISTGTKAAGFGILAIAIVAAANFLIPPAPDAPPIVEPIVSNQIDIKATELALDLESAKQAFASDRLTLPANNNVLFFTRKILQANPTDQQAFSLLSRTSSRYHDLAKRRIEIKEYGKAETYLNKSQQIIKEFKLSTLQPAQDQVEAKLKLALAANEKAKAEKAAQNKIYSLENRLILLPIPAGSFMMGGNAGKDYEKPVHKVTFNQPFWMGKTEITFDQYDAYAKAVGKALPSDEKWGRGTRPVVNVSWHDAQAYAKWLSDNNGQGLQCRLPSEAEWEYAARAGSTTKYFWGDALGKNRANCIGCGSQWDKKKTAPVGSFPANRWGMHDMHGNVWEWVQDPWHENYNGAPSNGEVWHKNGDRNFRVLRGTSWFNSPYGMRLSNRRGDLSPATRFRDIGFRIACSSQ